MVKYDQENLKLKPTDWRPKYQRQQRVLIIDFFLNKTIIFEGVTPPKD